MELVKLVLNRKLFFLFFSFLKILPTAEWSRFHAEKECRAPCFAESGRSNTARRRVNADLG